MDNNQREFVVHMMNRMFDQYVQAQELGGEFAEDWLYYYRHYNNLLTEMESK